MKNRHLHHSKRVRQSGMALLLAILLIFVFAIIGLALMTQTASVLRKTRLERKRLEVESFSRATMLDLRLAAQNQFVKLVAEVQEDINQKPIAGKQIPTAQQVRDRVKSMFPLYIPVSMSGGTLMHGVTPDPRWKGDGWEYMKGYGVIVLNFDSVEIHQVNGRPTAIGFFTLNVPYTIELSWEKQPDEFDLIPVLRSIWHPINLESKLAKEEKARNAGKPNPMGGNTRFLIQPKYQNEFEQRMMVQIQIVPPNDPPDEWHIWSGKPGNSGSGNLKENCGPWYAIGGGGPGSYVVVNSCGGQVTGHFTTKEAAQEAADALNEEDREAFNDTIKHPTYVSPCDDTGYSCSMVFPGLGDTQWFGLDDYGTDPTTGEGVFTEIPPNSPTRLLRFKVGEFHPLFPMHRDLTSLLSRKRGQ